MSKEKRFVAFILSAMLCLSAATVHAVEVNASPVTYTWGSYGPDIWEIQVRLKAWGYYTGNIDGKYGQLTLEAVKLFQSRNNLKVDGIAGPKTLEKLGLSAPVNAAQGSQTPPNPAEVNTNEANIWLLARLINGESRGEPYIGQVAVGAVVMNRVKSPAFPDSVYGVIYQPGAFDAVKDGQINLEPTDSCLKAARDAMNGFDPTNGALFYWNPRTATSKWVQTLTVTKTIENHVFAQK